MLAAIHDIFTEQKSEYSITFQYFDASDEEITIMDLYDNVRFVVRKSSLVQEKDLFEVSQDGSATEGYLELPEIAEEYGSLTVIGNEIVITISKETMSGIYPGSYFYYLMLETAADTSVCLLKGKFVVEAP